MLKGKEKQEHLAINRLNVTAHNERALKKELYDHLSYLDLDEIEKTEDDAFDRGQNLAKLEALYLRGFTSKGKLARKLNLSYTVVQRLLKIVQGRLYYQKKLENPESLKVTQKLLNKFTNKCEKLIENFDKSLEAIDKRLYDSVTGEFNNELSEHERINLIKAKIQINKYIHEVHLSINAIYGVPQNITQTSNANKDFRYSKYFDFSFILED